MEDSGRLQKVDVEALCKRLLCEIQFGTLDRIKANIICRDLGYFRLL